jgi:hypothetical protein
MLPNDRAQSKTSSHESIRCNSSLDERCDNCLDEGSRDDCRRPHDRRFFPIVGGCGVTGRDSSDLDVVTEPGLRCFNEVEMPDFKGTSGI